MAFKRLGDLAGRFLGINGAAGDATNPLSVRGPGSLFDGDTGGHQVRLNKATVGQTVSFLFQRAFSGRAEFGLIGNDDFELKVSPNGSAFQQALVVDKDTAITDFKQPPAFNGQALYHTGDFDPATLMPKAGGTFTGDVAISRADSPTLTLATTENSGEQANVILRGARTSLTATIATVTYQNNLSGDLTDAAQWIIGGDGVVNLATGSLQVAGQTVYHTGDFSIGDYAALAGATFTGGVTATGFTGPGGGLTGVNAANLGGQSAASYALLSGANFSGRVGINGATPDASNPLAFYGENALFNSGSSINLKFNKNAAGDDASITFQQGFSTQALFGLLGDNSITLKVGPSFITALVVDPATGVVSLPATPPAKFTINKSSRVYLYAADDRWVTNSDDNYGPSYYQNNESGGTGVDPIQEWEHMGEYVREGTVVHDLSIFGRITDANTIADLEILVSFTTPTAISRWDTTGVDNDAEDVHTELWRGFWKAGGAGVAAFTHPVNDQHRRKLPLDFTCPADGQLRIYYKPVSVDPRPNTANDYFLHSYSWLLSYA